MTYRLGTKQDIPAMCRIRKQQLIDEGVDPESGIDEELHRFFENGLTDGSLVEWLLEDGGQVIATAALLFMAFPPTYANPTGVKGYITNMYTAPAYRGQGIATAMLRRLTEEAKKCGVKHIWLHASTLGKSVYQRFGFAETAQFMELKL